MARHLVAIHQPNFFPWLGYFDKIARADTFVWLDDVQFERSGAGTWCNRVRLLVNGQAQWTTLPVRRDFTGVRRIDEMRIDSGQPFRDKFVRTLRAQYGASREFAAVFPLIEPVCRNPTESLVEYNVTAIATICQQLQWRTSHLVFASDLHVEGQGTDRLINLVKAVGGTAYLSGGGAGGYQQDEKFATHGVELVYQGFTHPTYRQGRSPQFVAGLSILDALFHGGFAATAALFR